MLKRLFDIVLAAMGIAVSAPLWAGVVAAILLDDGPPVFYAQERVGKGGTLFRSLKFRSMVADAWERFGPRQARAGDDRITRVGRILRATALDELPQLLNILRGDMSFVGPRALMPVETEVETGETRNLSDYEGFDERCTVRPGLTGVAQLVAPRDVPRSEKLRYDLWYVRHRSFPLDQRLIVLSFLVTALGRWEARVPKLAGLGAMRRRVAEAEPADV